jgi:hypothetical protein
MNWEFPELDLRGYGPMSRYVITAIVAVMYATPLILVLVIAFAAVGWSW